MYLCIVLFSLISPIFGYNCTNEIIELSPPNDLTHVTYWPTDWNDSSPPEQFSAKNSTCNWDIQVPQGLYANVVFYKNAPEDVSIYLITSSQAVTIANNDQNPYILTSEKSRINIFKTDLQGAFSFKVIWSAYPSAITNKVQLSTDRAIAQLPNSYITTFTAQTTVSFVAFSLRDPSKNALLRQSVVFDGDSTNATSLGNLYILMMKSKSVWSTGSSLTVYTFGLDKLFDYPLYMAQDHINDQNILFYNGYNCDGTCKITLNSVYGLSAAVTAGNNPDFIKSFSAFPQNATLKIYEGIISESNLLTTLTSENFRSQLPICTKNSIRHYVLDSKIIGIEISKDSQEAEWSKLYNGRNGFVHSSFFGSQSYEQDTDETFTSSEVLWFNYTVRDADFPKESITLTVLAFNGNQQVMNSTYNSKNLPPSSTVSILGDKFQIKYQTNKEYSDGILIDFSSTANGNIPATSTSLPPTTTKGTTGSNVTQTTVSPNFVSTTSTKGSTVTRSIDIETTTKGVVVPTVFVPLSILFLITRYL